MKFYLAAAYDRKAEMREYRENLQYAGHIITSRWIDGHPEINNGDIISLDMINDPKHIHLCYSVARHDLEDIRAADAMISFHGHTNQGGRHVEYGYALALEKPIYIIGALENLFHTTGSEAFETWEEFYTHQHFFLKGWRANVSS